MCEKIQFLLAAENIPQKAVAIAAISKTSLRILMTLGTHVVQEILRLFSPWHFLIEITDVDF